jgi:putative transposase
MAVTLEVNRKRIQRLMRILGIEALYPKPNLSRPAPGHEIYPYLLRGVSIERPNQVWSTDITYIPIHGGFLYLVAVMDWFSRFVLSWELSNTMETGFCLAALEAAFRFGQPEIWNSDQGSQFTSPDFLAPLKKRDISISMDGRGRALDNVFIERLWRSLKYELIYPGDFASGADLFQALDRYFRFYNYASYCPPRYVIDKSKNAWSCDANAGMRLFVRIRSTNWAAATVSIARRLRTQGPALNGCSASISPRSIARRRVIPLTPSCAAASVRVSQPSACRRSSL